ncbi:Lrs4p [Saccharomyces cerevisiae YJM453]|nr:Lrs4p [Saccharomyces cerevisiae YJM453]
MTTLLQLLSNYYKAKLDSERIYNEYVQSQYEFASLDKLNNNKGDPKKVVDETLFLQRQIAQLNKQLQLSFQENEKLLSVQKNQKALYQSKLSSKDAFIDDLKLKLKVEQISVDKHNKERTPSTGRDEQQRNSKAAHTSKPTIHLLSPIVNRDKPNNQTNDRGGNDPDPPTSQRRSRGLRSLLSSGKNTIFDSISKNLDDEINENAHIRNDTTSSKIAGKSPSRLSALQKSPELRKERNNMILKEHILRSKDDQNITSSRKLDNIELSSIGDSTAMTSRSSTVNANDILGNEENDGITKLKRVNKLTSSPVKRDCSTNKKRKLTKQRIATLPNSDEELSNNLNVDEFV